MSALPNANMTLTEVEYLAFERDSQRRHEFLDGQVYLMTGASRAHNLICTNIVAALHPQLLHKPCEIYQSDMRVNVAALYAYPDVTVVCDTPDFADNTFDTLLNPVLLIEVLSPSTEGFDRGAKFQLYREIKSFHEYLLVSQSSPRIEHYIKQNSGMWLLTDVVGLDRALDLESIAAQLALQDVYAKVSFEAKD